MSNSPESTQDVHTTAVTRPATIRKPYKPPVLTTYGNVAAITQSGSGTMAETGMSTGAMRKPSDCRLKCNISRIGVHPLGFGLYLFNYKPRYQTELGQGRQFGVMAQEVERTVPSAVSVNRAGFKIVDYAQLGIQPEQH